MKSLMSGVLIAGLMMLGCQKQSSEGGPGANVESSENVFKIEVPKAAVNVKQGQEEKMTVSIDRGKTFSQAVTLSFELPKGITLTPEDAELKPGQTEREFAVKAAKDADVGKHTIKVTGKPESGKETTVSFVVEVKKVEKQKVETNEKEKTETKKE